MVALQNGTSVLRTDNKAENNNRRLIDKIEEIDKVLSEGLK